MLLEAVSPTDPVQNPATAVIGSEALSVCLDSDLCIDQYLWSLYERTPKVDTVKVREQIKVKVKNKGKMRTVVKTLSSISPRTSRGRILKPRRKSACR